MPVIIYVSPDGKRRTVEAQAGVSVMKAAVSNFVAGIVGECGGEMSCATCHVYVDEQWADRFAPISDAELEMLDATAAEPTEWSRLSCQLACSDVLDGAVVHVPEVQ